MYFVNFLKYKFPGQDITQPNKQDRMINTCFVQFIFKSLIFACIVSASNNVDDYQLVQDALICFRKLNCLLGEEFCAFLRVQLIPKHFETASNVDELIALFLLSDLRTSKKTIKEALKQFKMTWAKRKAEDVSTFVCFKIIILQNCFNNNFFFVSFG